MLTVDPNSFNTRSEYIRAQAEMLACYEYLSEYPDHWTLAEVITCLENGNPELDDDGERAILVWTPYEYDSLHDLIKNLKESAGFEERRLKEFISGYESIDKES